MESIFGFFTHINVLVSHEEWSENNVFLLRIIGLGKRLTNGNTCCFRLVPRSHGLSIIYLLRFCFTRKKTFLL